MITNHFHRGVLSGPARCCPCCCVRCTVSWRRHAIGDAPLPRCTADLSGGCKKLNSRPRPIQCCVVVSPTHAHVTRTDELERRSSPPSPAPLTPKSSVDLKHALGSFRNASLQNRAEPLDLRLGANVPTSGYPSKRWHLFVSLYLMPSHNWMHTHAAEFGRYVCRTWHERNARPTLRLVGALKVWDKWEQSGSAAPPHRRWAWQYSCQHQRLLRSCELQAQQTSWVKRFGAACDEHPKAKARVHKVVGELERSRPRVEAHAAQPTARNEYGNRLAPGITPLPDGWQAWLDAHDAVLYWHRPTGVQLRRWQHDSAFAFWTGAAGWDALDVPPPELLAHYARKVKARAGANVPSQPICS